MLTNYIFWLRVTMKPLQILMNLKLEAVKKRNYQVYQLTLSFLLSIILYLFVKNQSKVVCACKNNTLYGLRKIHPLIWFHNRALNNRINRIHERPLRLAYQNKNFSFNFSFCQNQTTLSLYIRETCRFQKQKFLKQKIIYHLK